MIDLKPSFVCRAFATPDGPTLELRLFTPIRHDAGGFECVYEIIADGAVCKTFRIRGEDSLQALLLGLSVAATDLKLTAGRLGCDLALHTWDDARRAATALEQ